ncbi:MAG: hypothetical protein OHK0029_31180 [Armatimonadaceae bacterium]
MPPTVLDNVRWRTYECLLEDHQNRSAPRFAYNNGMLEIMSPLLSHEELNRSVARLRSVREWAQDHKEAARR